MSDLFAKYDVPAPRYTSYPTVPYWETPPAEETWFRHISETLQGDNSSWAMYIHIPYCETLCTFCGCNTIITKDHQREDPYVSLLLREWGIYLRKNPELSVRPLKHLHLGGGTPTFLSAQNLTRLLKPILSQITKSTDFEASIEVDPRRTNEEQLQTLRELGFNRISLGVQDFDPEVQRLVNRVQPFELTQKLTVRARELGFRSINFDLIYGLAQQTPERMRESINKTLELRPDRIALYSLALVPWIKPAQKLFKDEDLPTGQKKRELYELARGTFLKSGYVEVGMDHFALKDEALSRAMEQRTLHRNFMGYTDQRTDLLLGLGVSSISETPMSFHQNEKVFATYEQAIQKGSIPTHRGHLLTDEDRRQRAQILEFMTTGSVTLEPAQVSAARLFLSEMLKDGLLVIDEAQLSMTEKGKPFLRNACLFFDERLKKQKPQTQIFSKSL
jgi:oxygen-independent coproporphyrinogen III oxidase